MVWNSVDEMFMQAQREENSKLAKKSLETTLKSIKIDQVSVILFITELGRFLEEVVDPIIKEYTGKDVPSAECFYLEGKTVVFAPYAEASDELLIDVGKYGEGGKARWAGKGSGGKYIDIPYPQYSFLSGLLASVGLPEGKWAYKFADGYIIALGNGIYSDEVFRISLESGLVVGYD